MEKIAIDDLEDKKQNIEAKNSIILHPFIM